jgi:hypothetical protein
VAGVRAEGRPARGIDGGRRRLPRWLGGKRRGWRRFGQHANLGGALGSSEARGVAGRRRARAGAQAQGGGSNGGGRLGMARGGKKETLK